MRKEIKKQYKGLFEKWKIELAMGRIVVMGFPKSDWLDLMQELAITMLGFRYNPAKSNGATEKTALYAVVSHRLLHLMRTQYRYRAHLLRYAQINGVRSDGTGEEPSYQLTTPVDMDVVQACASLGEFDRNVCVGLAAGDTTTQIARDLDCDWHTVDKAIGRIGERFKALGLEDWVRP